MTNYEKLMGLAKSKDKNIRDLAWEMASSLEEFCEQSAIRMEVIKNIWPEEPGSSDRFNGRSKRKKRKQ